MISPPPCTGRFSAPTPALGIHQATGGGPSPLLSEADGADGWACGQTEAAGPPGAAMSGIPLL